MAHGDAAANRKLIERLRKAELNFNSALYNPSAPRWARWRGKHLC